MDDFRFFFLEVLCDRNQMPAGPGGVIFFLCRLALRGLLVVVASGRAIGVWPMDVE